MSDNEEIDEKPFFVERAKTDRATCKKCKEKCDSGELRIAKLMPNPFGSGKLKHWYHVQCLFESFDTQRATTRRINSTDDIDGWSQLNDLDQDLILEKMPTLPSSITSSLNYKNSEKPTTSKKADDTEKLKSINLNYKENSKDNLFREFRRICADITNESSYGGKTKILHAFLLKGSNKIAFEGDLYLWIKLLLPSVIKRIYNLQSKQLVKIFSKIFETDHDEMLQHLEQGDVSETIKFFFENSTKFKSTTTKSILKLDEVEIFLNKLSYLTKDEERIPVITQFCKLCTSNDLKMVIRLIKQDLRINSKAKHILNALNPDAYSTYQSTQDLEAVVLKYGSNVQIKVESNSPGKSKGIGIQVMCPISPMLAEACKSIEKSIEKNPQGMYSEIKYDGERVQLHKKGNEFKFYSRNLKPVLDHKIKDCREYVTKAFPSANDLILDSEILVVDTETGKLLPFGSLGKHKKNEYHSAETCLFVFDCIYYNGDDLTKRPLKERRKILEENIRPIKNHVQLSEYQFITSAKQLKKNIAQVLKEGLEGLVLKNINGTYEPGKRHWLKVKKDYLFEGQMADTADLVVLGAWFGTGKKGGMLSIFLMGCYDKAAKLWKTVTKVHSGFDDKTMDELQEPLRNLMRRSDSKNIPKWLSCKNSMLPDLITIDPMKMPVWEITGAEFSKADIHTADGISIRFPRVTKIRNDKSVDQATNLNELGILYKNSKESVDLKLLDVDDDNDDLDDTDVPMIQNDNENIDSKRNIKMAVKMERNVENEKYKIINVKIEKNIPIDHDELDADEKKYSKKIKRVKNENDDDDNIYEKKKIKKIPIDVSIPHKKNNNEVDDKKLLHGNLKIKSEPKNTFGSSATKRTLFEKIILYVPKEIVKTIKNDVEDFLSCGGKITNIPNDCTHALHKNDLIYGDLMQLRNVYNPYARHVSYNWLIKCIEKEEILDVTRFSIKLRNKS